MHFSVNFAKFLKTLTTSDGCFFLSQDAKHQIQLHPMGSLFDGKYNQRGKKFLPITEAYLELS